MGFRDIVGKLVVGILVGQFVDGIAVGRVVGRIVGFLEGNEVGLRVVFLGLVGIAETGVAEVSAIVGSIVGSSEGERVL